MIGSGFLSNAQIITGFLVLLSVRVFIGGLFFVLIAIILKHRLSGNQNTSEAKGLASFGTIILLFSFPGALIAALAYFSPCSPLAQSCYLNASNNLRGKWGPELQGVTFKSSAPQTYSVNVYMKDEDAGKYYIDFGDPSSSENIGTLERHGDVWLSTHKYMNQGTYTVKLIEKATGKSLGSNKVILSSDPDSHESYPGTLIPIELK